MKLYLLRSCLFAAVLIGCSETPKASNTAPSEAEPESIKPADITAAVAGAKKSAAQSNTQRAVVDDDAEKASDELVGAAGTSPLEASAPVADEHQKNAYSKVLLNPALAKLKAPPKYTVRLKTTKGDVLIDVTREWAPHAADRFFNLVKAGYFTEVAFYRVIAGFMAQAGIHGDPKISKLWGNLGIPDEPTKQSNTRGMVSFAAAGPNSRSTQFFINFGNNSNLDNYPPSGFPPFGKVRNMAAMDRIYSGYGEGAPMGRGPRQSSANNQGNAYFKAEFPQLDYIREARIEG